VWTDELREAAAGFRIARKLAKRRGIRGSGRK